MNRGLIQVVPCLEIFKHLKSLDAMVDALRFIPVDIIIMQIHIRLRKHRCVKDQTDLRPFDFGGGEHERRGREHFQIIPFRNN